MDTQQTQAQEKQTKRVTLYLPKQLWQRIKHQAVHEDTTVTALLQEILNSSTRLSSNPTG